MRARRSAASAGLELKVQRRGVAVERCAGTSAQAAAPAVVAADVERQDVTVKAHEHVRRGGEHVGLAEAGAEGVVRRLRLEHTQRGALAKLGKVTAQLEPGRDAGRRRRVRSDERYPEDHEGAHGHKSTHRGRLYALPPQLGMTEDYQDGG